MTTGSWRSLLVSLCAFGLLQPLSLLVAGGFAKISNRLDAKEFTS